MKSLEQFKAEQAEALEAFQKMTARGEAFAAAGFAIPEYIAEGKCHGALHVVYRNRSTAGINEPANPRNMAQAIDIFRQFANAGAVLPMHVLKDGYSTTLHPESRMPKKKNSAYPYKRDAYKSAGYAIELRVNHSGERHHTSASLEFFAMVGGELYSVGVEFGRGYIGTCPTLAPRVKEARGFRGRIEARSYDPHPDARALSDAMLSYGFGGDMGTIKTGADHRFLFVSDHDDEEPDECTHALGQLQNLAAIVDGVSE